MRIAFKLFPIKLTEDLDYTFYIHTNRTVFITNRKWSNLNPHHDLIIILKKLYSLGYKVQYKNGRYKINTELYFKLKLICSKENPAHFVEFNV